MSGRAIKSRALFWPLRVMEGKSVVFSISHDTSLKATKDLRVAGEYLSVHYELRDDCTLKSRWS